MSRVAARASRRIVIVDDQALLRRGLMGLIEEEPELSVCAEVATEHADLEAIASCNPELVIVGLDLEGAEGMRLVRDIWRLHPSLPVLVFSPHEATAFAESALQDGARGCVSKQETGDTVLVAIRRLLDGHQYVSPKMRAEHPPQ